jgi:hypothetical protein
MSYTELHTGKLKPIQHNLSVEDFKNWLDEKEGFKIEDFEEKLEDGYEYFEVRDKSKKYKESLYIKYVYSKGTLYEMLEHNPREVDDDLDITKKNNDGTIDFAYMFYNGGTCFSEMLEEGLNKI